MTEPGPLHPPPRPVPFIPDPRAELPDGAEVVIIGAGLVGAWTAYHLARDGVRALVLEANAPAWGASGRNAGMALAGLGGHYPRAATLARAAGARIADYTCRSLDLIEAADDALPGGVEWQRTGSLDVFTDDDQARHGSALAAMQREDGLDARVIDADELLDLAPALDHSVAIGAKWTPRDGKLNPFRLVYRLLEAAVARGARVATGVRIERIRAAGGRIAGVDTSHGPVAAGAVLVAANAWTPSLVPHLRGALTPIREHVCVTEPLPPLLSPGVETNRCNEYWRQMASGELVVGGYAVCDEGFGIGHYEMVVHPDLPPLLAAHLERFHPASADVRIVRCWSGLLDFASLEMPLAGSLPAADGTRVPGGYLVCGLTGHGHPYAPILGLLMAELIQHGDARTLPLTPFDPGRYVGREHSPTWLEPFGGADHRAGAPLER